MCERMAGNKQKEVWRKKKGSFTAGGKSIECGMITLT
jgi:hypothetical protein